jgi:O-antigen ligase
MLDFIARNKVTLGIFFIWYLIGSVSSLAFFPVGALTIFLWWRRRLFFEILLGFLFILVLSDNLKYTTDFANTFKNLYIVLLAAISILERRSFNVNNRFFLYFIPFIAVSLIGLYFSPQAFKGLQKTLSYILILFVTPQFLVKSFKDLGPVVIKDIIYLGVSVILLGFIFRFTDPGIAFSHGGRFRAIFGNPNGLGIFLIVLFAFALISREYFKGLFSKSDVRLIFLSILLALVWSASRSALISVSLLFLFTRFYKLSPFLGFIGFLGLAFTGELLLNNLVEIVTALGASDFLRVETLEGGSGRYIAWQFAWEAIQDHFWFGRGFSFDEYLMVANEDYLSELGHQGGVHNTYLIIWLNTGLVGLLLFLRAYLILFIKASKNTPFAFPVLYAVLFSITIEPWLAASLNPFTIMLLMSLVVMTEPVFQPYLRGERSSHLKPEYEAVPA